MKIGIITCNYRRPKILELWAASIQRIRKDLGIELPAVCVSDVDDKRACESHDIHHIRMNNLPVTDKWNRGMQYMRSIGADYVIISGSDNIFSSDTIKRISAEATKGYDVIGLNSIYFYAVDGEFKGKVCRLNYGNRLLGVGKTISKKVLDEIDWTPWGKKKNWGMDVLVTMSVRPHAKTYKALSNTVVFDCKSKQNLNKSTLWFGKLKANIEGPEKLLAIMGEEEKQILKTL